MNRKEFHHGIQLFNREAFFDAHEVWEDVWREAEGAEKKFLQGLIQVAVALHHHSTGNLAGARSLLERACKNLTGYPDEVAGIALTALLETLAKWRSALSLGTSMPTLPKLHEVAPDSSRPRKSAAQHEDKQQAGDSRR